MSIQLVGAGVGRTGTHSLKLAIEHLLGEPCYHMMELRKPDATVWRDAFLGDPPDWADFLSGYAAIVDWPGAGLWKPLAEAFPEAPVLLSTRSSADVWFESADKTIFNAIKSVPLDQAGDQGPFLSAMMAAFSDDWEDPQTVKAAYERHNAEVRATIAPERLFEYQPGDGWGPLCAALGVDEPDQAFPHTNTTEQFQKRMDSR